MRDSLLGKMFFALPDPLRRELLQVLPSAAFNRRPEVQRLLEYLAQFAGNGQTRESPGAGRRKALPALDKESAFNYAFGQYRRAGKPAYDDAKMRHLMTYSADVIRRFIAWNDWRNDPAAVALHQCKGMKKIGLDAIFESEMTRIREAIGSAPFRSADYYLSQYGLEIESWEFFRAKQRNHEGNLGAVGQAFGAYVAVNALRQGCAALAQQTLAQQELTIPYLPETLALVESGAFDGNHAVQTYYCAYRALVEKENDAPFDALKTYIRDHGALFPDAELRDLYILAINFCIRRLNAGERRYIAEAFDLYRAGLACKVFLENGYLSRFTYRNILNLALALNEWQWALDYLQTFAEYLAPRERDNVFRYNLATYYFRRPDYDQALELLRQVEFRDVLYNFDARRMLLRIYYERKALQALDSLLDSFSAYLQRHREAGYHREMYRNLVRFTKRLLALTPGDIKARERLCADVQRAEHVAERDWLLEMIMPRPVNTP